MCLYALRDHAQRTVCDRHGKKAFTVLAERDESTIRIRVEGDAPGLRIRLMGIPAVRKLSGARMESESGDACLADCEAEIRIEL